MSKIVFNKESSLLRRMEEADLDMVRSWRNHSSVRRYMYTQHEISHYEHCEWFSRQSTDDTKYLLIFESHRQPKGYLHLSSHGESPIADWGFYLAPDSEQGMGKKLGNIALEYSFSILKLHKICGEALAFNEKSIGFHKRLGFKQEGCLRDQYFDGSTFHDVCLFGLLIQDWITNRSKNG